MITALMQKIGKNQYSIEGNSADFLLAGIYHEMKKSRTRFNYIWSNHGNNCFEDIFYSGPLCTAMKKELKEIKSITLSQTFSKEKLLSNNFCKVVSTYDSKIYNKILYNFQPFLNPIYKGFYNINFSAFKINRVKGKKISYGSSILLNIKNLMETLVRNI